MKKFINTVILIMTASFVLSMAACGDNVNEQQAESDASEIESQKPDMLVTDDNEQSETAPQTAEKKVLVVYFSATGTTKEVAEKIADIADADIYEILPANPYSTEDLNYNDSQSRASIEMNDSDARPEIGSEMISLAEYSTLYIGYPIWWGTAPRVMSTFVESYDFDGITVVPFCTSGSSDIGSSDEQLAEQAGSGTWITGKRFSGSVSETELQNWIEDLQ